VNLEKVREYCLKKRGTSESMPFNDDILVFKVMNKMFCLANMNPPYSINLKCDPELAIELREKYDSVLPGYHMNKEHWNTIDLSGGVRDNLILEWIDNSYDLIVESLPKKLRAELDQLPE
jgi:predicted DNA-binding protein (MmcQ/YjbR family)